MHEVFFFSFLAGIISLDIMAFGQFMISRPIVCAPVFGYLLGDIQTGLWIGMIVELLWISVIPMGAAIPQDNTSVAVLTTIWSITAFPGNKGLAMLSLIIAAPCGILFKKADIWLRYFNVKIVHWVETGVKCGNEGRINRGIYLGLILFFVKAFIFYFLLIYPGKILLQNLACIIPVKIVKGLELSWVMLPLAGMGMLLVNFRNGFLLNKCRQ